MLTTLNFSSGEGIRADKLNQNFNTIEQWIRQERLRTSG